MMASVSSGVTEKRASRDGGGGDLIYTRYNLFLLAVMIAVTLAGVAIFGGVPDLSGSNVAVAVLDGQDHWEISPTNMMVEFIHVAVGDSIVAGASIASGIVGYSDGSNVDPEPSHVQHAVVIALQGGRVADVAVRPGDIIERGHGIARIAVESFAPATAYLLADHELNSRELATIRRSLQCDGPIVRNAVSTNLLSIESEIVRRVSATCGKGWVSYRIGRVDRDWCVRLLEERGGDVRNGVNCVSLAIRDENGAAPWLRFVRSRSSK